MAEIIKAAPAKAPGLHNPAPKLVKRESFAALNEAAAILESAHAQAARILASAEHEREQITAQARRDGEAEGLRRYLDAIAGVSARLDEFYQKAEPELVKLATGVARKIVSAELASQPSTIVQMVRQALTGVRQARRVVILSHPSHIEALREHTRELDLSSTCEIQVMADASLTPGSCRIETELGLVDARLETQLEVIEKALTRRPQ